MYPHKICWKRVSFVTGENFLTCISAECPLWTVSLTKDTSKKVLDKNPAKGSKDMDEKKDSQNNLNETTRT